MSKHYMILLDKNAKTPYYQQISDGIKELIESGFFAHGKKLPTLIEFKDILNVSLKVVAQAYDDLNQQGYIYSRRGKGYFVKSQFSFEVNLDEVYELDAKLIYQMNMKRSILVFETIKANNYIANSLKLEKDEECYRILQYYGKEGKNALIQEIYLPKKLFPNLRDEYEKHLTLKSLIERGYNFKNINTQDHYYSSFASIQEELILELQVNDPIWKIESTCINNDEHIALINDFMSGDFITMAVLLDVK